MAFIRGTAKRVQCLYILMFADFSSEFSRNDADFRRFRRVQFRLTLAKVLISNKALNGSSYKLSRTVDTKGRGIDSHIVVIVFTPLVTGVEVIVG